MRVNPDTERKILEMAGLVDQPADDVLPDDIGEAEFQAKVKTFAENHGWTAFHVLNSRGSLAGFPDLHLFRGPRYVVAELKTAAGKVSAAQKVFINRYRKAGVPAYIWRPGDWESIKTTLRGE